MGGSDASWTTVAMILLVIVGCILTVFLAYLVRSAYELRIGLKAQLDRGLKALEDEGNKKARGLRQELGAEIERARSRMVEEAQRRLSDEVKALEARQLEVEKASRQERVETATALDALRDEMAALRRRIAELERELLAGEALGEPAIDIASAHNRGAIAPSATAAAPPQGSAAPVAARPPAARR